MRRLGIYNVRSTEEKRKVLRAGMTLAEVLLWKELQGRKLGGRKFRRQQGIGKYIVDFCCPEMRLVVELGGAPHFTEEYLESQGFRVIRLENRLVLEGMEFVLEAIRDCLQPKS